jgi:hypothetical protein
MNRRRAWAEPAVSAVMVSLLLLFAASGAAAGARNAHVDRRAASAFNAASERAAAIGGRAEAAVRVPAFPSAVAVGGGSVWTLAEGRLVRIDPKTKRVVARIDLGVRVGSELTCDLAVGGGVVWTIGTLTATRSRVLRVDARTGRTLGSTLLPAAGCVAATGRTAWVTLPYQRALVQLDRRGRVLSRVATYAYCDRIVAGHGALWAACPQETAGAPVGRYTGTILRVTAQGALTAVAQHVLAGALAAGPAGVFASGVNHDSGTTVRVDRTGVHFLNSGAFAVDRSMLWSIDWRGPGALGFVRERDVRTGKILRTSRAAVSPLGIALGAGVVWVSDYAQPGAITRIAP